jgi:hypothetical protein
MSPIRRLLFFCILACVGPHHAHAQATKFIASKSCGSNPGCTTAPMDNTPAGASGLLAVCVSSFNDASLATVSSVPANSFTHTADFTSGNGIHTALFYALAPAVSASQTVTVSNGGFTSIFAMSFSNIGSLRGAPTGAGNAGASVQPGSQTPSVGDLAVSCGAAYPATPSVSSPFFIGSALSSASQADGAGGFTQATTTTALNPSWTMTGTSRGSASVMALFGGSLGAGSATLSLSSPTLSADGKTLTAAISGCSTSLSPSSAVTGVTVYSGGVPLYVSGVTASGCVLTASLGSAQQTGDTITMDLDIGLISNLTDAAGDTPAGDSGAAVTNSSSQAGVTANYNSADVYAWGAWSSSGGVATATSYPAASLEFACANSTDAQILGPSTGVKVQTDGGPYTTIAPSASGYSWQPIATGLSFGTHRFKVISTSVTAENSVRCSSSGTAALTPIAPYSGAAFYSPQSPPLASYMAGLGAPQNASFGGIGWTSANGGIAIHSSASNFSVYTFGNGGSIQFFQDATLLATLSIPNDSTYDAVVLGTGLTGTHTYRAIWQGSTLNNILNGLIVDSAPAGPPITTPPLINTCGDSISVGFGIPGDFGAIDWWQSTYRLGNGLALSDQFQGASGQQVYGGGTPLSTLCPAFALPSPAAAMWLAGGVNDQINGVSQANFGPAYLSMITNTAGAAGMMAPGGTVFARAILPNTADHSADRSTFNATIQAEVNAYNAGSPAIRAIYIPTDNWIDVNDSSLWLSGVPLHPNAAGYAVIANLETPIMAGLAGASYTLSCPDCSNARVGVPVAISVCLAGGATWTELNAGASPAETLNLSVSGITGSFNRASPWNPAAGRNCDSTSLTFTPSSTGSGTISLTATSAGWVDPAGVLITSTASPPAIAGIPPAIY